MCVFKHVFFACRFSDKLRTTHLNTWSSVPKQSLRIVAEVLNYPTYFFRRTEQVDFQILCVIEFSSFSWIELCLLYSMCYFILLKGVIMCKNLWLKVICNLHSSIYFWIRDKDSIFSDLHNKHLWSCFRCVILSLKWLLKTVFVYFIVCFFATCRSRAELNSFVILYTSYLNIIGQMDYVDCWLFIYLLIITSHPMWLILFHVMTCSGANLKGCFMFTSSLDPPQRFL